jgi:hypothetical protein
MDAGVNAIDASDPLLTMSSQGCSMAGLMGQRVASAVCSPLECHTPSCYATLPLRLQS